MDTVLHPFRNEYTPVVQSVTCDIHEGEFFGLLGPNGAGKTTLFKMLATLVTADAGTATVGGFDVVREASRVRDILAPVIADERSLHWRLTARENLQLFAALHGLRGDAAARRVEELLAIVGLGDASSRMVNAFSSGMKQRLLIARSLLTRPRVLLLDEPTRSLDPLSARTFRTFLREDVALGQGCTVLLATHNAEEALDLCDRVGVLDRGNLLAVGPASQLMRELGEQRYRMWTRTPDHPAISALAAGEVIQHLGAPEPEADGWSHIDMEVPGGMERAAHVVDVLTCGGVSIARFEHVELSLADLLERIVERGRVGEDAVGSTS